jgi:hypothetical protein
VREYSNESAAQRTAARPKAITLDKLRHSNIARMRAAGIAADVRAEQVQVQFIRPGRRCPIPR